MTKHYDFYDFVEDGFMLIDFDPVLNPENLNLFDDCGEYSWDEMNQILTTLEKSGFAVEHSFSTPANDYKYFYLKATKDGQTLSWGFQIIDEEFLIDHCLYTDY